VHKGAGASAGASAEKVLIRKAGHAKLTVLEEDGTAAGAAWGREDDDSEDETDWYLEPIHVVHDVERDLGLEVDLSTIGLSRKEMREMEELLPMLLAAGGGGGGYREGF
jgi:hypothetical protein